MEIRKAIPSDTPQLEDLFLTARRQTFIWENPQKFKLGDFAKETKGETVIVALDDQKKLSAFSLFVKKISSSITFYFSRFSKKRPRQAINKQPLLMATPALQIEMPNKNLVATAFYLKNNWIEIEQGVSDEGEYRLLEMPALKFPSEIVLVNAKEEDKATIQNLGRLYVYDMSRYCGSRPGWETPLNGLFECRDLSFYWVEPNHFPFLIKVDNELAGFVLINKIGTTPDVDWNIGEFFIVAKFQGRGIGSYVAAQIFSRYQGTWETAQMPENKAAIDFWEKVVANFTNNQFEKSYKIIPKPKPHPMIVLKFIA